MTKAVILVVDDDTTVLSLMRFHLERENFEVFTAESGEEGLKLLAVRPFDVALLDLRLPDLDGLELVKRCKELSPETEVIVITGYASVSIAVEATRAGAFYFVEKPIEFEQLVPLVSKAVERRSHQLLLRELRDRLEPRTTYCNIIGTGQAMRNVYDVIESISDSDANVLIVGESGTGKEMIANAVHAGSRRSKHPFVKINCAALPKELIESELFGHAKGAFTGATRNKPGLIGQAEGGSLLMDEIGEMPLELQPKLLRILQERVYTPVGSESPQEVDFRLICATNRDPLEAVSEGKLRDDLYYRINTVEIRVPPLRERREDIPQLAEHFVRVFAEKYGRPVPTISPEAYEALSSHSWPGNIRELQNLIERTVLINKGNVIEAGSLPLNKPTAQPPQPPSQETLPPPVEEAKPRQILHGLDELCRQLVNQLPATGPAEGESNVFERMEGSLVMAALERTGGNKQAAANLLGLYRPRLYSIIKRHNLAKGTPSE
ncbi:MAG TPA: sigma-54 dependent transcriptional regulator [Blastocatellia bacterium]|nr:sigma-54 dependent transcriptional regulator [Blastocatellia bacterium]HMX25135.1 sigma-54 dependent transcriptional regulator [Blastocatellia bacterium]HMY75480.1 sigma-54 dependent transcriptional regulator [Blastocatellia bacterium]HMZ21395.1 sigma-54 dependent transcriptional regulator [Blastocatellia bacterium]HNG32733.1 sigma-54 dependent transcriptional regulator [Blastocatellia bacterium]